jgi:hypothetical protein
VKTSKLIGYFLVPALVCISIGIGKPKGNPTEASVLLKFFIPNYLFFVAPLVVWAILSKVLMLNTSVSHAGYIGVTLALLSLHVLFECCADNSNAIGWLYYWPLAAILATLNAVGLSLFLFTRNIMKEPAGRKNEGPSQE